MKLEYIASSCHSEERSGQAFVIAPPQWFREYDGTPIQVTESSTGYEKFKAILGEDVSARYWIDPNGKEHKFFRYTKVVPTERKVHGIIKSARTIGNVTVLFEVRVAPETYQEYFCRQPLKPSSQYYFQWLAARKKRIEDLKKEKKSSKKVAANEGTANSMNGPLLVGEYHFGDGPVAEIARHLGGIKRVRQFKGVPVKLTWTDDGVCHIFPSTQTQIG